MTEKPMFFQVLMPGFSEKLEIPTAFLKHIIPEKTATIWSPLGRIWSVKIQGSMPHLYFGEGWDQFAQSHSLDVGYFLVFSYEGDMDFSVVVLDTSSCRKEYTHLDTGEGVQCDRICEECRSIKSSPSDDYTEIGDGDRNFEKVAKARRALKKEKVLGKLKHLGDVEKKVKRDHDITADVAAKGVKRIKRRDKSQGEILEDVIHHKRIKTESVDAGDYVEKGVKAKEDERVLTRADIVIEDSVKEKKRKNVKNQTRTNTKSSENCVNVLKDTGKRKESEEEDKNVDKDLLYDQEDHVENRIKIKKNEVVARSTMDAVKKSYKEKKTTIKTKSSKDTLGENNSHKRIGKENENPVSVIKERFKREISNGECKNLKNSVRRDLKNRAPNKENFCPSDVDSGRAILYAPAAYRVTLQPRNLQGHYYLYIPVQFKEDTGISGKDGLILKDPKGDRWQVEVLHSTKNRTLLVKGWKEFCLSNELRAGDDCEFQLAPESERNKKMVQVHVFKKSEKQRLAAIRVRRTSRVCLAGTPSFWNILTEKGIEVGVLQIPNAFVAATNIREKRQVTLGDKKGRLFIVNLIHTSRNRAIICKGWKTFCDRNDLKPGDVCEFKLDGDANGNNLFQVRTLQKPPNPESSEVDKRR